MADDEKEFNHANPYNEAAEAKRRYVQDIRARASEQRALDDPDRFENWLARNPVPDMHDVEAVRQWNLRRLRRMGITVIPAAALKRSARRVR